MSKSMWNTLAQGLAKVGLAQAVEETPDNEPSLPSNKPISAPTPAPISVSSSSSGSSSTVPSVDAAKIAEYDEIARKALVEAMENADATSAEQLDDFLESMSEIADERIKYVSAMKFLVKQGNPVAKVITDFDKCVGALEEKGREFNAQLEVNFKQKVGGKIRAGEQLAAEINAKNEQVVRLQKEISELVKKRNEETAGVFAEENRLNIIKSRFEIVYNAILKEVTDRKAKVITYGEGL